LGEVPTVVIGPGEMGQAHQTDEYCTVRRIEEASEIYRDLIRSLCL
jgi:succinyl-diaminopimelate desuccinylase